ncbi:gag-pol polyprotein, partial [Tanacetum coccineum]
MEMWTRKPVNYSDPHIFGNLVYVIYNSQETTKLSWISKSRKCLFLGYADGVKGYRLWDPTANKMEKEFGSYDSFEVAPQRESNVAYCLLIEEGEPSTLQEALNNPDASFWKATMQEEIKTLHKNKTWELMRGNKTLVVKEYAQKEGIDFNKIFSLMVRMTTVRVVLAMCDSNDLHLEQLDVKTVFLHGNLEGEIYMLQPEDFEQKGKENLVCMLNKSMYTLKQASRCPNKDHISKLKAQLGREFEMKDLGPANKILGMQIHRDRV